MELFIEDKELSPRMARNVPIYYAPKVSGSDQIKEGNGCVTHTWWSGMVFYVNSGQDLSLNIKQTDAPFF